MEIRIPQQQQDKQGQSLRKNQDEEEEKQQLIEDQVNNKSQQQNLNFQIKNHQNIGLAKQQTDQKEETDRNSIQEKMTEVQNEEQKSQTSSQQNRYYARLAMERQMQMNNARRLNNRDEIRDAIRQRDLQIQNQNRNQFVQQEPVHQQQATIQQTQQQNNPNNNSQLNISRGSLGLNMSFANVWSSINEDQERKITQEFFLDMGLLALTLIILYFIKYYFPKGCGIPLREWLMVFACLYFSRSSFQLIKVWVIKYMNQYKLWYDIAAFIICNGAMIGWMYYGYVLFYSEKNDCDNYDDTAFLNSIMFVILFIGYFLGFVYLMVLLTVPCLYLLIRDQAENNRIRAGGVGQSQVPMILASLPRTQYDPQIFQHENNCIICLVDYEPNCTVTQLKCDQRHYFHTKCLEDWVKQGNNRCPFCRKPIIDFSSQNEEEESLVSSQDRADLNHNDRQNRQQTNNRRRR